jgi:hypothetical protein
MARPSLSNIPVSFRKNMLINGDMRIYQRDDSKAGIGNGDSNYWTLDRWRYTEQGAIGGEIQQSVNTNAPSAAGFATSMWLNCTTAEAAVADTEQILIEQRIEAQDLQHLKWCSTEAKDVTLSFYLQAIAKTGIMAVSLKAPDPDYSMIKEFTVSDANWNRYEITFPGLMGGDGIPDDNGSGLRVMFSLVAGANFQDTKDIWHSDTVGTGTSTQENWLDSTDNNIYITGVQLEVGGKATDFDHRPYAEELLLCQRYFEKSWNLEIVQPTGIQAGMKAFYCNRTALNQDLGSVAFTVTKCFTPTVTLRSPNNGANNACWNNTQNNNDACTASAIGIHGFGVVADADAGNAVGDRMEMHWEAEAEL